MFKPTSPLQKMIRRLPLSTKQAGKEYYKGNRVGNTGKIDKFGNFAPDWSKIRTYVFPVQGTQYAELTPFVSRTIPTTQRSATRTAAPSPYPAHFSGDDYLRAWKLGGGYDVLDAEAGKSVGKGKKAAKKDERGGKGNLPVVEEAAGAGGKA
ncbi:hypothetical protein IAQ61_010866 [Plenodomus lingam]|uniref:50S ribosomal protein YmL27 n=1 Tax=Leptosphaeria maculans (strain JN3 / isolate v23.1.3 / race Av1-4-5-6-7-8) TaxID=985895 RepID=E4ZJ90_LEPMJ|nr:hypothetical protein LEMA_P070290.1 [Plenodomus lingam JN3]KAH9861129.1 hypothetical protein IAQ61_010866 [Plenodomus lingam]CBX91521.1 hypothetical protein LEMA_P070290.1 [Plenodomus lingam JN3]